MGACANVLDQELGPIREEELRGMVPTREEGLHGAGPTREEEELRVGGPIREETATTVPWSSGEEEGEAEVNSVVETLVCLNSSKRKEWCSGATVEMCGMPSKEAFFHPVGRKRRSRLTISLGAARLITGCKDIKALATSGVDLKFTMHFGAYTCGGKLMLRNCMGYTQNEMVFANVARLREHVKGVGNISNMKIVFQTASAPLHFFLKFVPK